MCGVNVVSAFCLSTVVWSFIIAVGLVPTGLYTLVAGWRYLLVILFSYETDPESHMNACLQRIPIDEGHL